MTNTLHRQGSEEDLKGDYVIFVSLARDITRDGSAPKIHEFLRICQKHGPVNIGSSKWAPSSKRTWSSGTSSPT